MSSCKGWFNSKFSSYDLKVTTIIGAILMLEVMRTADIGLYFDLWLIKVFYKAINFKYAISCMNLKWIVPEIYKKN